RSLRAGRIAAGRTCPSGCRHVQRVAEVAPYSAAFSLGDLLPRCGIRRASGADVREEVGWYWDAGCVHAARPIAPSRNVRSILAATRSRRLPLPRSHPDAPPVLRIGSSGKVPEAAATSAGFLLGTWRQPGVWSVHGYECWPSALPSGRDRPVLLPGLQSASL